MDNENPRERSHVPIAICGYGYRLPGGLATDEDLWNLLDKRGYVQESIGDRYGEGEVPWDGFTDSPLKVASPYEGLIKDGKELEFDCELFGMSMSDAKRTDPQIKMMLSVTWEALQCAGMDQAALHNSNTGVFCGHQTSAIASWKPNNGATPADVPGKSGSMIANRISYHFNWMGPSSSIATACSSGITALDAGIKSLDCGECDMVACGAVQYLGAAMSSVGFNQLRIISKTGESRSFDKNANGYMRSEGAFMFILKRLSDAELHGDKIFGVIRGCALNTAGAERDADPLTQGRTITAPVGHAQEALMRKVMRMADCSPADIDYIEAHATGTPVGDKIEGNAIAAVYGSPYRETHARVASTRSNLGHMEAASFASSLLKVLLMLQKRQFLPISSHFKESNPTIPFVNNMIRVQTRSEPFPDLDKTVLIGINSFGFGGANGHCIIEEYHPSVSWSKLPGITQGNKFYMVPLSAKSEDALVENARLLLQTISTLQKKGVDLYTLVANLSVRMTHHRVRTALVASTLSQLGEKLSNLVSRADNEGLTGDNIARTQLLEAGTIGSKTHPSVAIIFPGQGSQWIGCGRELYETELVFRRVVDAIDTEWINLSGSKLSDIAFDEDTDEALGECKWAQPVTFMLQVGLYEMLKVHGVHPTVVLGHSAGETAAAYASGAYCLKEACRLVYHRARLQNKMAGSGRMLVLMMESAKVKELLAGLGFLCGCGHGHDDKSDYVEIACFNAPNNTVVCGSDNLILKLHEKLKEGGHPIGKLIPGNIAFHSRHMLSIRDEILETLFKVEHGTSCVAPMVSTVTCRIQTAFDSDYWWSNVREPVNLLGAMESLTEKFDPDVFIELSPHITLRSPIRDSYDTRGESMPPYIYSLVRGLDTASSFAQMLGGCFKAGLPLDFSSIYPKPRPITHLLPSYYMKEERVIDPNLDESVLIRKGRHSAGPLLGRQMEGNPPRYQTVMSKNHFSWMAHHVVQGSPIVPATAYVELLFEAFQGKPIRILSANILAPFILTEEARDLLTNLRPYSHAPHKYDFTIASHKHGDSESESTVHCVGVVEKASADKLRRMIPCNPPSLSSQIGSDYPDLIFKDKEEFYAVMSARIGQNFAYGPLFQSVKRVYQSPKGMKLQLEIEIDQNHWEAWDQMGYFFHPTLLDGALQCFLVYLMYAPDFEGIPQAMQDFIFFTKPTSGKITCFYTPTEDYSKRCHQKGQPTTKLGTSCLGEILIYDTATGELAAWLGDYTSHNMTKIKNDLGRVKHSISWQPKDISVASKAIVKRAFGSRDPRDNKISVQAATCLLINSLVSQAHPTAGDSFFVNAGEYIVGESPPTNLAMKECLESIVDAPVQFTLVSSDTNFLTKAYEDLGTSNQGANLRFIKKQDDFTIGYLRPAMFELLTVRMAKTTDMENHQHEVSRLTELVAPGGLMLIEYKNQSPHDKWKTVFDERWKSVWQAHGLSEDNYSVILLLQASMMVGQERKVPTINSRHAIVDDTEGFADYWREIMDSPVASTVNFTRAHIIQRVDYFALHDNDIDTSDLFDGPARLVEWVKKFALQRTGKDVVRCHFTVFTCGAVRDVTSPQQTAFWGATRSLAAELDETCNVDFRLVDLATKEDLHFVSQLEKMREREMCVHEGRIWTSRLLNHRDVMPVANISSEDQSSYRLETNSSGSLADLEFRTQEFPPELGPDEVEVAVKAAALNFRDIMVGLGKLPALSYERSALGRTVGMECAGVVQRCGDDVHNHRVGDKVIVMSGGSIANRVRCNKRTVCRLPTNLSYEQGSAVLSVYVTAYYALIHLARIRRGKTVLVHSAMGGVGQAAIALAKLEGAQVYATAGSDSKRKALLEKGCLAVYDSHSTDWYDELMEATGRRGVDVVLNSLAGEHVDLCLEALAPCGFHCEIGKVDIFADRPMKMAVFRKNLTYRAIDVDRLMMDDPELMLDLIDIVIRLLEHSKVSPIPVTTYPYKEFRSAFNFMMSGQHRGKVVLIPPSAEETLTVVDNRPLFSKINSEDRTVLLSGSLGGFGLRLFAYVAAMGARHILVLDRDKQRRRSVDWLLEHSSLDMLLGDCSGLNVKIVYADVSKYEHVVDAVSAIKQLGMPSLGSVFHLAGVLEDKLTGDLDRSSFERVYAPKANGAWNLHKATQDCDTLNHFVMVSSTSSTFGNAGQVNYSAANAFQDGLADYRRHLRMPALSFCMGAVKEAGMAARNPNLLQMMKSNGMPAISCILAMETLDYALRSGKFSNVIAALAVDLFADFESTDYLRVNAQLVRNVAAFKLRKGGTFSREGLCALISKRVATLCGVEAIDPTEPFSSYGLNSISVAELRAYLKNSLSYTASAMELMTSANCESIADGVLSADDLNAGAGGVAVVLSSTNGADHKRDSHLWGAQAQRTRPSLFAPAMNEYFQESVIGSPRHSVGSIKPLHVRHVLQEDATKSVIGHVTGRLPPQCEEVLYDLLSYVQCIDTSIIAPAPAVEDIRTVLVTGATGFVGRHFVTELLKDSDAKINKVYCPVRASDDDNALQRVIQSMEEAGVWSEDYRSRIHAFQGDLLDELFGANSDLYEELAQSVDAIYHFASSLNLVASFKALKQGNCLSLRPVLRLCLSVRKKHLFHASTLGIFPQYFCLFGRELENRSIERDAMPNLSLMKKMLPLSVCGYPWSKLVNEMVLHQVAETKGIPLAIFRLPFMVVNSLSGYVSTEDPSIRLFLAILQTRLIPGRFSPRAFEDGKVCNEIMLQVSLNPSRKHRIYHCMRLGTLPPTQSPMLDMLGFTCKEVSYIHFKEECQKIGDKSPLQRYWMLLDRFAPYWIDSPHSSNKFPVDVSTVNEDVGELPREVHSLTVLRAFFKWGFTHADSWPIENASMLPSMDMESIMAPSRRLCTKYGLDFDTVVPPFVVEGLCRICGELHNSSREEMPAIFFNLASKLETRVNLHRCLQMHPEILDEPIIDPVFILGLNRTGTTFLHRLLEASGRFQAPHIEEWSFLPSVEQLVKPTADSLAQHADQLQGMLETMQDIKNIHEVKVGLAEEELCAHSCSFASHEYNVQNDLPKYAAWLNDQTLDEVYREHRQWMQFIAWYRRRQQHIGHASYDDAPKRWCYKLPWHARSLDALLRAYPDALLVHTHRNPLDVAGSWCSLVESLRKRYVPKFDRHALGTSEVEFLAETLTRAMKFRLEHPELEDRWLDVTFADLVKAPVSIATEVLVHADAVPASSSKDVQERMEAYIAESVQRRSKKKSHMYSLDNYGIDRKVLVSGPFETYRKFYAARGITFESA